MPPRPAPTVTKMGHFDTAPLLLALRQVRDEAGTIEFKLKRQCLHRAGLEAFRAEIDELAGLITGDRTYFAGKNHGMPPGNFHKESGPG